MFDLKRPCTTCPFRKGNGSKFRLALRRLTEIFNATSFQCHKTVDYDSETDDEGYSQPGPGKNPQECAGLMAILTREGKPHQMMRIAGRCGIFNPAGLDPKGEVYAGFAEAISAHRGREPA